MLRPVNSIAATPVSGTEGTGSTIFWSPTGDWIGFHAAGAIRKITVGGRLSLKITETADLQDADWNTQGDIIFRVSNREPLQRVRDSGGNAQPLTKLNAALLENSHRFPRFLPGGRQFLFVTRCADRANNALYIGSLDTPDVRKAMFAEARVTYVNGSLVYYRDGALVAQNFDLRTAQASGDPRVIVRKVGYSPASILAFFDVSNNGSVIVSSAADRITSRLVWFDRRGQELGTLGNPGPYQQPRISASGDRVLLEMPDPRTGNRDLAFIEVTRAILHRLTNHPSNDWFPVWSPDGTEVAFGSDRVDGRRMSAFLKKSLDQAAPETRIGDLEQPSDWLKDGWIAAADGNIRVASVKSGERVNLSTSPGRKWAARFSPDSRWLAYSSDESGRSEIYVRAFPGRPDPSAATIQLSNNGGEFPMWTNTGTEVYYMSAGNVVFAVDLRGSPPGD